MQMQLTRYAGWTSYVNGIVAIASAITLMLFFGLEAPQAVANPSQGSYAWGTLNDIIGCLAMLPMLVLALTLYQMERERAPGFSRLALLVGVVGMLGVALLQLLLILKVIPFEQEVGPVVIANGVIGLWLILVNIIGRVQRILPAPVTWLGIVTGACFVSAPIVFSALGATADWRAMMSNPLLVTVSAVAFMGMYLGFPLWALWLGRVLSKRSLESTSTTSPQEAFA